MFYCVHQQSVSLLDVITVFIAGAAFTLSVIQAIEVCYRQRFSISEVCTGYCIGESDIIPNYRNVIFGLTITNNSSLPISINAIHIRTVSNHYKSFLLTKRFLKEHFIPPGLDNPYQFFTTEFPVNIDAYSSALVYVMYETEDPTEYPYISPDSYCEFEFITSRKKKPDRLLCSEVEFLEQ